MLDEPKYWISLIVGLIVVALGGIPLLGALLPFSLPAFLIIPGNILLWVAAVIGAYLLIDVFLSLDDTLMWLTAGVTVIILAIVVLKILGVIGIIGFTIPYISETVLRVLFVIEGAGLIIAGFGDK